MIRMRPLLTAFAAVAAAGTAAAQSGGGTTAAPGSGAVSALKGHDANAPVDVEADRIEVQDRADRAVFSGNVHAKQAEMTMDAARVTVAYTGGAGGTQIQRLDASGGVTVKSPTETATGQYAIYDLNRRLITMLGGVTLVRGESRVNGARLVIDLNTGRATVDGNSAGGDGGVSGGHGGRVSGRFTVPQRNTQQ